MTSTLPCRHGLRDKDMHRVFFIAIYQWITVSQKLTALGSSAIKDFQFNTENFFRTGVRPIPDSARQHLGNFWRSQQSRACFFFTFLSNFWAKYKLELISRPKKSTIL